MISPAKLEEIEQAWLRDSSRQRSFQYENVLLLVNEVRRLRDICLRVVEADSSDSEGNALMEIGAIAEQIRSDLDRES